MIVEGRGLRASTCHALPIARKRGCALPTRPQRVHKGRVGGLQHPARGAAEHGVRRVRGRAGLLALGLGSSVAGVRIAAVEPQTLGRSKTQPPPPRPLHTLTASQAPRPFHPHPTPHADTPPRPSPPGVVLDLCKQQEALQRQHHAEGGAAHVGALQVDERDGKLRGAEEGGERALRGLGVGCDMTAAGQAGPRVVVQGVIWMAAVNCMRWCAQGRH